MAQCSDNVYILRFTDANTGTILVSRGELINDEVDVTLIGRFRKNYGQEFNENLLHLLENFSCPEDSSNPGNPDLSIAFGNLLSNPISGQKWFNSTNERIYFFSGTEWIPIANADDVAGNYGVISHGEQLPRPVGQDGYVFPYDECSWNVSPYHYSGTFRFMRCYSDSNARVTMQYILEGEGSNSNRINGVANYQIIGIKGEDSVNDTEIVPFPTPSNTPAASPTPTPSSTPTVTATPTADTLEASITTSPLNYSTTTGSAFITLSGFFSVGGSVVGPYQVQWTETSSVNPTIVSGSYSDSLSNSGSTADVEIRVDGSEGTSETLTYELQITSDGGTGISDTATATFNVEFNEANVPSLTLNLAVNSTTQSCNDGSLTNELDPCILYTGTQEPVGITYEVSSVTEQFTTGPFNWELVPVSGDSKYYTGSNSTPLGSGTVNSISELQSLIFNSSELTTVPTYDTGDADINDKITSAVALFVEDQNSTAQDSVTIRTYFEYQQAPAANISVVANNSCSSGCTLDAGQTQTVDFGGTFTSTGNDSTSYSYRWLRGGTELQTWTSVPGGLLGEVTNYSIPYPSFSIDYDNGGSAGAVTDVLTLEIRADETTGTGSDTTDVSIVFEDNQPANPTLSGNSDIDNSMTSTFADNVGESGTIDFRLQPDYDILVESIINGNLTTSNYGSWLITQNGGLADQYEVRFTQQSTSGVINSVSGTGASFQPLSATRTVSVNGEVIQAGTSSVEIGVEIREIGNISNSITGTVTFNFTSTN